jgi:bacillithiol system protein YtxJ
MGLLELKSIEDLDKVLSESENKPVLLYKHSTTCSINFIAKEEYEKFLATADGDKVLPTYLDLLVHRDVSSAIEERTGVRHQSPQLILVVNGKAVWSATHDKITMKSIADAVRKV